MDSRKARTQPDEVESMAQDVTPTHSNVFLSSEYDILTLFEAVRLGRLPLIHRHLNERESVVLVRPNTAFVFEEQQHLRRWTDGRAWSSTHRLGRIFVYYELEGVGIYESRKNGGPRARSDSSTGRSRNRGLPPKQGGLHKYAYSALVSDPSAPDGPRRRLHLTWYKASDEMGVPGVPVSQDPYLRDIVLPDGVYFGTDETPLPVDQSVAPVVDRAAFAAAGSQSRYLTPEQPASGWTTPTSSQRSSPLALPSGHSNRSSTSYNSSPASVVLPPSTQLSQDPIFPSAEPYKGRVALPSFQELVGRTGAASLQQRGPAPQYEYPSNYIDQSYYQTSTSRRR